MVSESEDVNDSRALIKDLSPERACADPSELVSIFIVCKDRVQTVRRCIESILNQTYPNIEIVVQDGVSTDGTLEILREYEAKLGDKFKLVSEPDRCAEEAFWRVLKRCNGAYITSCMTDEELLPNTVALGVDFMRQNTTVGAMTGDIFLTDLDGNTIRRVMGYEFNLIDYAADKIWMVFPGAMFRKQAFLDMGLLTREWNLECGEFEFWLRLGRVAPVVYVSEVLAKYAEHKDQHSADPRFIRRSLKGHFDVLREIFAEAQPPLVGEDLERACLFSTAEVCSDMLKNFSYFQQARELLEYSVRLRPDLADLLKITPTIKQYLAAATDKEDQGDIEGALQVLAVGIRMHKHHPKLFYEKAKVLFRDRKFNRALSLLKKIKKLFPDFLLADFLMAQIYERFSETEKALECWRQTFPLGKSLDHSFYLHMTLTSLESTPESLLDEHRHWAERYGDVLKFKRGHAFRKDFQNRKITIGYHSSFWEHSAAKYPILPVLKHRNKERFCVIGYDNRAQYHDYAHQKYAPEFFDEMRNVKHLSDEQFVDAVRADDVDIFVELSGHSGKNRFVSMSARLAPVQISYLNYLGTCGVPNVDYVFADANSLPSEEEAFFTETVYRLENGFICFNYDDAELLPLGSLALTRHGYPTFGCFAAAKKVNDFMIQLWSEILHQVPSARMVICNNELSAQDVRDHLTQKFIDQKIEANRVLIYGGSGWEHVMKYYRDVDVILDTFPYNGSNSIAEPLWQGVPVITLKGNRFASAYGSSFLLSAGCPELIAYSKEEYISKAVELAQDETRLAHYRKNLRQMMFEHGLSDTEKFARKLEAAYEDMLSKVE